MSALQHLATILADRDVNEAAVQAQVRIADRLAALEDTGPQQPAALLAPAPQQVGFLPTVEGGKWALQALPPGARAPPPGSVWAYLPASAPGQTGPSQWAWAPASIASVVDCEPPAVWATAAMPKLAEDAAAAAAALTDDAAPAGAGGALVGRAPGARVPKPRSPASEALAEVSKHIAQQARDHALITAAAHEDLLAKRRAVGEDETEEESEEEEEEEEEEDMEDEDGIAGYDTDEEDMEDEEDVEGEDDMEDDDDDDKGWVSDEIDGAEVKVRRMEHPSGACGVCGKPALYEYVPKERLGGAEARQGNVNVPIE